jgi:GTP-binding protein
LADLPGYGYAHAPKVDIEYWRKRLVNYLENRTQLERLFVLVDARHGLKESDGDMMALCDALAIPYQIIMTKADKAKKLTQDQHKMDIGAEVKKHGAARPNVILTSADKKWGIAELSAELKGK